LYFRWDLLRLQKNSRVGKTFWTGYNLAVANETKIYLELPYKYLW